MRNLTPMTRKIDMALLVDWEKGRCLLLSVGSYIFFTSHYFNVSEDTSERSRYNIYLWRVRVNDREFLTL